MASLVSTSATGALSSETPDDVASQLQKKREKESRELKMSRQFMVAAVKPPWQRSVMSQETADKIITANVEASLSRFEPPARICDPSVLNALAFSCGKGILKYIPDPNTIFDKYVVKIDAAVTAHMISLFRKYAGNMSVAFDGVTVLGRSHILYTVSKGDTSMFVALSQLGDQSHVTEAEADDAVVKLQRVREEIGCSICSAAVDNGAGGIANAVIQKYAEICPEEPKMLRTRDPGHCIDLLAKDSVKVTCFKDLLSTTKAIISFLSTDRVIGIVEKAMKDKDCAKVPRTGRSLSL